MTLPIGMLFPFTNKDGDMKWAFAKMVNIPEEEIKNYPIEGDSGKFYEKRVETENAKEFDIFVEALSEVNNIMKSNKKKEKSTKIKLPKLKKIK